MNIEKRKIEAVSSGFSAIRFFIPVIVAGLLGLTMVISTKAADELGRSSEQMYAAFEHRSLLDVDTVTMYNGVVCTLAVFQAGPVIGPGNGIIDTTWTEHLVGVDVWSISVKLVLAGAGDSTQVDSMWHDHHSQYFDSTAAATTVKSNGPFVNAGYGSVIIGTPTDEYNLYGPFGAQTTGQAETYVLEILRGQATYYVMAKQTTVADTTQVIVERWRARGR